MVEKVTDSASFLNGLLAAFKNKVSSAFESYKSSINSVWNDVAELLRSGPAAANNYLVAHPVDIVAYSPELVALLGEIRTNAIAAATNKFSAAQALYSTTRTNAILDFNQAINDAYTDFNFAISSAYIVDENFSDNYTNISNQITAFLDDITSQREEFDNSSYMEFLNLFNSMRSDVNQKVAQFISDRPIVRFTGKVSTPSTGIVYDSNNTYSFELENAGKKPWSGTIVLKAQDEYYKVVRSPPVSSGVLAPGSKKMHTVSIYIPRVMEVIDKTTQEKVNRNFGKNVNISLELT